MLFMGQEWSASSTFSYFTDHEPELGRLVRAGRAGEFRKYDDFRDPARLVLVPDPQLESTFRDSTLRWDERDREPHASALRLHRALLHLRRAKPAFRSGGCEARAPTDEVLTIRLGIATPGEILVVIRFRGSGPVDLPALGRLDPLLSTEDPPFAPDPRPIRLDDPTRPASVEFARPGAILFRVASA